MPLPLSLNPFFTLSVNFPVPHAQFDTALRVVSPRPSLATAVHAKVPPADQMSFFFLKYCLR